MGRRILNRKEMRADYEEAERRRTDEEQGEAEEETEEDDDEEEEEGEEGEEGEGGDEEGEEEEAVAPKKAPKKPAKPKVTKSRARTPKVVRMRVVWGVFNNSHQQVATYEYKRKQDADAHAAKLTADKKSTHFVQPVKEAMEEKKE